MNSSNIYEVFGNIKEKGINQNILHKPTFSNLNIKQKIRRNTPTKKLNEKFFSKKSSITPEKLINDNSRNRFLEYKKLSKKGNEFGSISTTNLSNLTYQENSKCDSKYNTINNFNKKKIIEVKQKNNETLNPFFLTERKERTKSQNKYRLNETPKFQKTNKINKKIQPGIINNKNTNKKINELEMENKKLKEEINKLKKELYNKDKIIKKQNIKIKEQKNSLNDIVNNNRKQNKDLLDEIEKIKSIIPFDILPGEKIMSIIFKSDDENILYSILCKNSDKFTRLKNIIYDKYPEYKEYENYFLFNEEKINENKTLEENKIKEGSIITIFRNND